MAADGTTLVPIKAAPQQRRGTVLRTRRCSLLGDMSRQPHTHPPV